METESALTTVIGQNYAAMPSRMVEAIALYHHWRRAVGNDAG